MLTERKTLILHRWVEFKRLASTCTTVQISWISVHCRYHRHSTFDVQCPIFAHDNGRISQDDRGWHTFEFASNYSNHPFTGALRLRFSHHSYRGWFSCALRNQKHNPIWIKSDMYPCRPCTNSGFLPKYALLVAFCFLRCLLSCGKDGRSRLRHGW